MPPGVVAQHRAHVLGNLADVAQKVLDRLAGQVGVLLQRAVGVVHVRLMVAVVMDLHGLGADVRLERIEAVRKRRKLISHVGGTPLL